MVEESKIDRWVKKYHGWIWGIIIFTYAVLSLRCLHQSMDDMYIIFRYVWNVVHGNGFVFNTGERVEGFTSFVWVMLLYGFVKLGIPVDFAAKGLSVFFGGACLWLVYHVGRELWWDHRGREWLPFIPVCLLAVNPVFDYWVVGGLATMLYCATILLVLLYLLKESRELSEGRTPSIGMALAQGAVCGLSVLTRPEGVLLLGLVVVARPALWRFRKGWLSSWTAGVMPGVIAIAGYVAWRYTYFGDVLPNTYYAKMIGGTPLRFMKGWGYFIGCLSANGLGFLGNHGQTAKIGFALFILAPLVCLAGEHHRRRWFLLWVASVLFALGTMWEGGDWMPNFRFMLPTVVIWMMLTVFVLVVSYETSQRVFKGLWMIVPAVVASLVVLLLGGDYLRQSVNMKVGEMNKPENWPTVFAHQIEADGGAGGTIALSDIGLLSWLRRDSRIIDMVGLVDKRIARSPGPSCQKDYDMAYVLDQRPDYVILNTQFLPDRKMRKDESFLRNYDLIRDIGGHGLFERRAEEEGLKPET